MLIFAFLVTAAVCDDGQTCPPQKERLASSEQVTLVLERCIFAGNINQQTSPGRGGGAISSSALRSSITIKTCTFNNCEDKTFGGGAIGMANGVLDVFDTVFLLCKCKTTFSEQSWNEAAGGAIFYWEPLSGENSEFNSMNLTSTVFSNCYGADGGALASSMPTTTMTNVSFKETSGRGSIPSAGAIEGFMADSKTKLVIRDCLFRRVYVTPAGNNIASYQIIRLIGSTKDVSFVNCSFDSADVKKVNTVGLVELMGEIILVESCTFKDCDIPYDAGALSFAGGQYQVLNTSFINCKCDRGAGAISYLSQKTKGVLKDCSFVDCRSRVISLGGGMKPGVEVNITNCTFDGCVASLEPAISVSAPFWSMDNCTFCNFKCEQQMLSAFKGDTAIITGCQFINVTCKSRALAALRNEADPYTITFEFCTFKNCSGSDAGAIQLPFGVVSSCHFIDCRSTTGGAVTFYSPSNSSEIFNCTFSGCGAENVQEPGGAIHITGSVSTISACNFEHVASFNNGIVMELAQNGEIRNCIFSSPFSFPSLSVASSTETAQIEVIDCKFVRATSSMGGTYLTVPATNVGQVTVRSTYVDDLSSNSNWIVKNGNVVLDNITFCDTGYSQREFTSTTQGGKVIVTEKQTVENGDFIIGKDSTGTLIPVEMTSLQVTGGVKAHDVTITTNLTLDAGSTLEAISRLTFAATATINMAVSPTAVPLLDVGHQDTTSPPPAKILISIDSESTADSIISTAHMSVLIRGGISNCDGYAKAVEFQVAPSLSDEVTFTAFCRASSSLLADVSESSELVLSAEKTSTNTPTPTLLIPRVHQSAQSSAASSEALPQSQSSLSSSFSCYVASATSSPRDSKRHLHKHQICGDANVGSSAFRWSSSSHFLYSSCVMTSENPIKKRNSSSSKFSSSTRTPPIPAQNVLGRCVSVLNLVAVMSAQRQSLWTVSGVIWT